MSEPGGRPDAGESGKAPENDAQDRARTPPCYVIIQPKRWPFLPPSLSPSPLVLRLLRAAPFLRPHTNSNTPGHAQQTTIPRQTLATRPMSAQNPVRCIRHAAAQPVVSHLPLVYRSGESSSSSVTVRAAEYIPLTPAHFSLPQVLAAKRHCSARSRLANSLRNTYVVTPL